MRQAEALLPLLLALAAPAARGADGEWDLGAELGGGVDTNPDRLAGGGAEAGGFALALGRARAALEGEAWRAAVRLGAGARLYPSRSGATAGAWRLEAASSRDLAGSLQAQAGLAASGLSEVGGRLDRRALRGLAGLRWDPGAFGASLEGGWAMFGPRGAELRAFRASGPEGRLLASWSPSPRHLLTAGIDLWRADYPGWPAAAGAGRRDDTATASAEYAWSGPLLAALGYSFSSGRSTAPGGDLERHRVSARAAAALPRGLTLAIRASLQWSRYPEPLYLPQQLLLAAGGESQDAVEARLTVPLGGSFELALASAAYWSEAVSGGTAPSFFRSATSLTAAWRAGSGYSSGTSGTP